VFVCAKTIRKLSSFRYQLYRKRKVRKEFRMPILKTEYNEYMRKLAETKLRLKRDRAIVKIISDLIKKKFLTTSEQDRLNRLLNEVK